MYFSKEEKKNKKKPQLNISNGNMQWNFYYMTVCVWWTFNYQYAYFPYHNLHVTYTCMCAARLTNPDNISLEKVFFFLQSPIYSHTHFFLGCISWYLFFLIDSGLTPVTFHSLTQQKGSFNSTFQLCITTPELLKRTFAKFTHETMIHSHWYFVFLTTKQQ